MNLLSFEKFDGTIDPTHHLTYFKLYMMLTSVLEGYNDAILCNVFLRSLKEAVLKWFGELTPNTITSYAGFVKISITHFVSYRTAWKKAHVFFFIAITLESDETREKFI